MDTFKLRFSPQAIESGEALTKAGIPYLAGFWPFILPESLK